MPTVSSPFRLDLASLSKLGQSAPIECECSHPDSTDGRCDRQATVRVTLVCAEDNCDCAAGVYLLCPDCLDVWTRRARRDGVTLRVRPL